MRRILQGLCPHWWTEKLNAGDFGSGPIMFEIARREKCMVCGKRRIHARVPEPHPTREKEELVEKLQRPERELIVDEWLPYGSMGPPSGDSDQE